MAGQVLGNLAAGALADRLLGPGDGSFITWSGFVASATVAALVVGSSLFLALRRIQQMDAARVLRGD
jgi:ABC-type antimicrobial peptide transport system permease subunit